jgi:hypothetical protein
MRSTNSVDLYCDNLEDEVKEVEEVEDEEEEEEEEPEQRCYVPATEPPLFCPLIARL